MIEIEQAQKLIRNAPKVSLEEAKLHVFNAFLKSIK